MEGIGTSPDRLVWSVQEVAFLLGVTPNHVYHLARSGKIGSVKAGDRVLIPKAELQRFLDSARPAVAP